MKNWRASTSVTESDYAPRHVTVRDGVKHIASCYYGETDKERLDNAKLIAMAPKMLEALRELGKVHKYREITDILQHFDEQ